MKTLLLLIISATALTACGSPQVVRDTEAPEVDDYALSLRLDRKDLERLYDENAALMLNSRVVADWERAAEPPVVAIFPMRNETSEHIDGGLDALLSKMETHLVNNARVDVVSYENQPDLIAEVKAQQGAAYDPNRLAEFGRQLGAQFFVTGKVYDVAEVSGDERRVQYFMFMQVINVATGAIKFQNESALTKAYMR